MKNSYIKKNPNIFKGIDTNDIQRVSRAISVYENTGITLSDWQKNKNKRYFQENDFIKIYLKPPKQELEKRIKKRFIKMLENGAIEEVKNYKKIQSQHSTHTANSIIGIEEIALFLAKVINKNQLKEKVLIRTRQYAKRQFTWQRGQMKDWKGFSDTNYLDLRKKILSYLSKT